MDGWDEEAWYARWQEARCHRLLGDEAEFLAAALQAYDMRPWRAEPLYDIAKFYRERGANETAALFCEMASGLPWPAQDKLFIDDFVYQTGLKEEFSIAGYYCRSAARKQAGRAACFALALDASAPPASRALARQNLFFYAPTAEAVIPSTRISRIDFTPPDDYRALNPSVTTWRGQLHVLLRSVNYRIDEAGRYKILHDTAVNSRNFLLRLDRDLQATQAAEVRLPIDLPSPRHTTHRGFEDGRLFVWGDALCCSHTVRELSPTGMCEIVRARIDKPFADDCALADWKVLRPFGDQRHEKNWMPLVEQDTLRFIYSVDPTRIVDEDARTLAKSGPDLSADHLRGGSQAIAFDGGWLALVHEAREVASGRNYLHRFIWLDDAFALRRVSEPFCFKKTGIEFACGLTWHADAQHLIASFGVDDCAAYLATMLAFEVRALLFGTRARQAIGLPDSIRH